MQKTSLVECEPAPYYWVAKLDDEVFKMELAQLLNQMDHGVASEKTASESGAVSDDDALKTSLAETLDKTAQEAENVASASSNPVDDLKKIAADLAGTEKDAEIEHAKALGLAFADAAINKFAAFEAELSSISNKAEPELQEALKVAAAQGYTDTAAVLQQQNPSIEQWEKAANQGDPQAQAYLQKLAEDEFVAGQNQALEDVHSMAANEFMKGAMEVDALIKLMESQG